MLNNLTKRLSRALQNINDQKYLTEDSIKKTLREVRVALLEADVALPFVRDFIERVSNKTVGIKVNKSLTPGQELIKIVHSELISAMGEKNQTLSLAVQSPTIMLVIGLQGTGKTTTIGKLSKFLRENQKKKILVVSVDIYRPAAIKQLKIISDQVGVDCFSSDIDKTPVDIIISALKQAKLKFYDILLIDTAGLLHTNKAMMNEIKQIHTLTNPTETLLVADAMSGQDIVNIAKEFDEYFSLTGVVLTKVDGDARGGSVLSIRYITGKPIKFLGTGEKIDDLEPFNPERVASNILGMNDILSLIEDIQKKINRSKIERLTMKLKKEDIFDLNDFLEQLHQMKNIGGITNLISKLPGLSQVSDEMKLKIDDKVLEQMEAIINSMTLKERTNPNIINDSRKRRIAIGCGMKIQNVNRFLNQFENMKCTMKKMKKNGLIKKIISSIKEYH